MEKQSRKNLLQLVNFFKNNNDNICIVANDAKEADDIRNILSLFFKNSDILLFPENEILPYDHMSMPEYVFKKRFECINKRKNKYIVITTVKNLYERYHPKSFYKSQKTFEVGSQLNLEDFKLLLNDLNYIKVDNVYNINEYSIRGSIIDVSLPTNINPLRIEFFDNKIESIRVFNKDSQLTISKIKNFNLTKGSFIPLDSETKKIFKNNWREKFENYDERECDIFNNYVKHNIVEGIEIYLPLFFTKTSNLIELFNQVIVYRTPDINRKINSLQEEINHRYKDSAIDIKRPTLLPDELFFTNTEVKRFIGKKELNIKDSYFGKDILFKDFIEDYRFYLKNFKRVVITFINHSDIDEFKNTFKTKTKMINEFFEAKNNISLMHVNFIHEPINFNDTLIISSDYKNFEKNVAYSQDNKNNEINNNLINTFEVGDYITHQDYGIGIFHGLKLVKANNIEGEYLQIEYENNEKLYVPVKDISLLTKYFSSKDGNSQFKLDSLSSKKWSERLKIAKKNAFDHATNILDIESKRSLSHAKSMKINNKDFEEFNDRFPYKETIDQINAVNAIQKDLSLIRPMNRLLCGDVGFGKTEVAVRASYISIYNGYQTIILVPSTILCNQHYTSFKERYSGFGVNIDKLNRHCSTKKRNEIVSNYNNQNIDILICTHIIFNSKINYDKTSLLIVDEEHRFGLKQKNIIKSKQENIHILYLSATPIPRTMNFVFSGLKDFSYLSNPPDNRLAIKSYFIEIDFNIIKEAITRELSRKGQVFIVQNDISKMKYLRETIQKFGKFTIGISHGKLSAVEITDIMKKFQNGSIDILICTTIVEMGLDIPNANTIIIIDSHKFGLAQLHQLRGRVGRSQKQAYCYFTVPTKDLPKKSLTRLNTININTKLGSGYFIAQEDLEIRGAGEFLGEKQSGHINNVGLSMYLSLLKESINIQKKEFIKSSSIDVNFYDSALINSSYLPSPTERLKFYKKLESIDSIIDLNKIKENLKDRCGKFTEEVKALFINKEICIKLANTGVVSIKSSKEISIISFHKKINEKLLNNIVNLSLKNPNLYNITKEEKFIINISENNAMVRRANILKLINEII